MIQILFAGRENKTMAAFIAALDESDTQTTFMDSGRKALIAVTENTFDLVVAEEDLGDMTGFELVESIITVQPMLNSAIVTSLSAEDFHEAGEGLGILMQLPYEPDKNVVDDLLGLLTKIQSITHRLASGKV